MKGTIRENLGGSRYIVGIAVNAEPVTSLLEYLNTAYADISQKLIQAQAEWLQAKEPYDLILADIAFASAAYQDCLNEFNVGQCTDDKLSACESAYSDCEDECYEIESGEGECDFECQRAREACKDACQRQREACRQVAEIECQEALQAHVTACQEQWSPIIAQLQAQAVEALVPVQDALTKISECEAQQLSLARRITELEGVASREEQVTCWRAQYDDTLTAGTAVDVARTPAGRNVITEIVAPDACLQDARGLPSEHLFINSAIYPGFETWRPTWRTGTVQAINEDDTLKVEIKSGTLSGNLGTIVSRDPIDCTPPQAYFDGNWQTAEERIKAARDTLKAAQTALQDAAKIRDDCIAQYDQTWSNICYTDKIPACDSAWSEWLDECGDSEKSICEAQYEASLAACQGRAFNECVDEQNEKQQACINQYQPIIDGAQSDIEKANADLATALLDLENARNDLADCKIECYAKKDAECIENEYEDEWELIECYEIARVVCDNECNAEFMPKIAVAIADRNSALDALAIAQQTLSQAIADRDACLAEFNQNWLDNCTASKQEDCVQNLQSALAECEAISQSGCLEQYNNALAICYAQALAACADEKDALIAQCLANHQPAVDDAQAVVDDAAETLHLELTGIYQPASPLVLDLPVVHCSASRYAVNDDVLIDFSTRSGGTPMSVWDSARVIGWASETKRCQSYSIEYNTRTFAYSGYPVQMVYEGEDGTPITIFDVVSGYYGSCKIGQYTAGGSTIADLVFQGWSDGRTDNPRQETNVQDNIYAGTVGTGWPREIYLFIDITQNPETGEFTEVWVWNAALQFYSATGIPDWFGTKHWFTIPWPEDLNAIGYSDDRPPIYIGKTEDLPGILPSTITVETVNLSAYGLSEKSKTYSRTGDFIYGNECSTAYPAYRYTRVD